MDAFELDARLVADSHEVGHLPLCCVLLADDARYPWVILVPRRIGVREIHELAPVDRRQLLAESCRVAECLQRLFAPDKLNLGALGNLVPQLHLHHIARFRTDPAWPGPVWGHSRAEPYAPGAAAQRIAALRTALGMGDH
ncbi:MAG: hypothetical protein RLZ44_1277 [Pseudomonadota bacterium]